MGSLRKLSLRLRCRGVVRRHHSMVRLARGGSLAVIAL